MGAQCCSQQYSEEEFRFQPIKYEPKHEEIKSIQKKEEELHEAEVDRTVTILKQPTQSETINLPDGSRYEGSLVKSIPHGIGKQYHENGDVYHGKFIDGFKSGFGEYQFQDGTIYKGNFHNGEMNGEGRIEWPNGDWYEGELSNNIINGYGKYYNASKKAFYQGNYRNGIKHGQGVVKFEGHQLHGFWEEGQLLHKV